MVSEEQYKSRYTAEEIENALTIALSIARHNGIPKGTGDGNILIVGVDSNQLSADSEKVPTSAVVRRAIDAATPIAKLFTYKGSVQAMSDLPEDAVIGDVYLVKNDSESYAWNGSAWQSTGKLFIPPVESVNGKTGAVSLSAADVKARPDSWMPTATDIGALPSSGGTMTGAINMNGQPISGLNQPTQDTQAANKGYVDAAGTAANEYTDAAKAAAISHANAVVRAAAPRNLLDNSDFTNLVAQAGIGGNHGTIAYAADRWLLDSGTVSYAAGVGLTLNGTIRQKLEFPPTGQTSAFVGMASGTASINYADGAVTITSSGGVIKWAALYGGVYLVATMPDYQPKGYGAELAECQRYYRIFTSKYASMILPGHVTGNSANVQVYPPNPIKMRISNPTATLSGSITIRGVSGYASSGNNYSGATVSVYGGDATYFSMLDIKRSDGGSWGTTNNTTVSVQFNGNSVLEFFADL